ncbi:hypothetical protein BJV82DRAFT_716679 [Fennellomyces sp. T-0311]|nr:hypothetical protein BJV82DRAFT_716679 [Fennellomyces sp. T-0311]
MTWSYTSNWFSRIAGGGAPSETNTNNNQQQYDHHAIQSNMHHSMRYGSLPGNQSANVPVFNDMQHNLSHRGSTSGIGEPENHDRQLAMNHLTPNISTSYFTSEHQPTTNASLDLPETHRIYPGTYLHPEQDVSSSQEFVPRHEITHLAHPIRHHMVTPYAGGTYDHFAELNSYNSTLSDGIIPDGSPATYLTYGSSSGSTQEPLYHEDTLQQPQFHHQRTDSAGTLLEQSNTAAIDGEKKIESGHDDDVAPMEQDENLIATIAQNVRSHHFGYSPAEGSRHVMEALRPDGTMSAPVQSSSQCGLCSKTFSRARDTNRHIRTIHNAEEVYSCEFSTPTEQKLALTDILIQER